MNYKPLPTGISDFAELRNEGYYYVDKTMYIARMEETSKYLFFTRPRRFGKSLFVSMVREYYDMLAQDRFEAEFKGTWIYEHPTKFRGKYQILYFDFSKVMGENVEEIKNSFNDYCSEILDSFIDKYATEFSEEVVNRVHETTSAATKLNIIGNRAKIHGHSLYIIVDEYDNFTNNILTSMGLKTYTDITHGTGFYRDFLKIFKAIASRYLLMGISPCTLDDVTSGFNNFVNITADPNFNMALGFSESEVREMIGYYQQASLITRDADDIINEIRPWYDNYCFSPDRFQIDPTMFNSDMVLYYMYNLISRNKAPRNMVDPNTKTDYERLNGLIALDTENEERKNVIRQVIEQGSITAALEDSFPAQNMIRAEIFPSLLYYYGMLTIGGSEGELIKMVIPNENVHRQYYQFLVDSYQRNNPLDVTILRNLLNGAAYRGQWHPLMEYLTTRYKQDASLRDSIQGEKHIQGYLLAYLSMNTIFTTRTEFETGKGYCDFFMFGNLTTFPDVKHSYIIELKYLKSTATEGEAQAQWDEAVAQLHRYATDEKALAQTQGTTLHLIALQMRGQQLERMEEVKS